MSAQYKQIGNAVPVNLAHAFGRALVRLLNQMELSGVLPEKNMKVIKKRKDVELSRHSIV